MRKSVGFVAAFVAAALTGCVVTPAYRPAPPPPPPPPAPAVAVAVTPAGAEFDAQITEAPPPLPVYEQPPCPTVGYIWTPGLWRWGPSGYFWVPGTWVAPPSVGVLWTPGYWGIVGGVYAFHAGYWGAHVGFYGGINYGGGYVGTGFAGGRWAGNSFQYNTAITNVNTTVIHNTYNQTVVNNVTIVNNTNITQASYAGAPGTRTQPTPQEAAVANEPHTQPTPMQVQHEAAARANPELVASHNQGRPPIAATTHAGAFTGAGVTAAKPVGTPWHPSTPAANAVAHNLNSPAHTPPANAAHPPGANGARPYATNNAGHPGQPGTQAKQKQAQPPKAAAKGNPPPPKKNPEHPDHEERS
jgi:hypothetical protein